MVYYKLVFAAAFLPACLILYQLIPKKYRWVTLLLASVSFYSTFSIPRILFPVSGAVIAYGIGLWLEHFAKKQDNELSLIQGERDEVRSKKAEVRKKYTAKSRAVLILGIVLLVLIILFIKYTDFAIENVNAIFRGIGVERQFSPRNFILPLGISFYTLQAIGYLADVYWKKIPAQKNPLRLLLFLMFFPTIIEGPIAAYSQMSKSLYEGSPLDPDNIIAGYLRLGWGAMKKLVIADRLYPVVCWLYYKPNDAHGVQVIAAAVLFTVMEYMDFSGSIDMALGCGRMFGIILPENFKQPFLAKNASEFWRRWHISLGVWFKTYIFYPVSMSTAARKWAKFSKGKVPVHFSKTVASAMALFPVWLCIGLWHGPKWSYIFYGMFYFVVILWEFATEPLSDAILTRLKLNKEGKLVTVFRVLRTWIVIFLGELFFEANTVTDGFKLLGSMFRGFDLSILWNGSILEWGMDKADWVIVLITLIVIGIVNMIREKGTDITGVLLAKPLAIRWAAGLALILVILIFGQYGPGFLEVNLIYAGF